VTHRAPTPARMPDSSGALTSSLEPTVGDPPDLGPYRHVYIHVPFCGRRCSYCDFAIAVRRIVPATEFNDAIMAELATRRPQLDANDLRSLYLGGGTPSKLGGAGLASLIERFARHLGVDNLSTMPAGFELTVEANPEDVNSASVTAWAAAGVNRVSLGVQSFDREVLRWMHRQHSPEQVGDAVQTLRAGGIQNLSLDLIFALPDRAGLQRDWSRDLDLALALEPNHLSMYGLTVEPRAPVGRWAARGELVEAPDERFEAEFLEAHERAGAAGFEHYEVSNHGKPGFRAVHNSAYWSGVPYLALGPAAHGFDGRSRRWNRSAYADWLRTVQAGHDPMDGSEALGPDERLAEAVYLGLRTIDGLPLHQNEWMTVTPWINAGWARRVEDRLVLTPHGWLLLDSLAATLTSHRSHS
jgi:oxygen-independent coproporphyrinogen-3 oxidase